MDSSCKKMYGVNELDAKTKYTQYFSPYTPYAIIKESTINPMQVIYKAFSTGMVTGRTVIDFCKSPIITHLLAMKDFVHEIKSLHMCNAGVKEIEKWKNKDQDAFNWSHAVGILKELKGNRDKSKDEEEDLRGKLKEILELDFNKGIDSLCLPKADIVTSIWFLDAISKNHDEYRGNLRQLSNLIKCGGYVLIYACINCSYFKVGDIKYHVLSSDESFFRKVISEGGFDIKHFQKLDRLITCDSLDHDGMVFIIAQKVKEPQEAS
ncbi:nicotinamide N-methyltransferase-like isoform X2 [Eleutherodactylus coqui]